MSFRICAIGCGGMATLAHGPSFKKYAVSNPDTELSGCCDLDDAKAAAYQAAFGFRRRYTDTDAMLAAERPHAVSLVVPVDRTAALAVRILDQGFPLIVEKPPGMTREETLKIVAAAGRKGVPTQAAFNRRYVALITAMKDMIARCGAPLQNIRCDFFRGHRLDADFSTTAIHGIDALRFIAGEDFEHIRFRYRAFPELGPTVADVFMDGTLASGATAQLSFCPVSGMGIERFRAHTIGQAFEMSHFDQENWDGPGRLVHLRADKIVDTRLAKDAGDGDVYIDRLGFYRENAAFFDDIRAGRRPVGDVRTALQSVEVMQCMRERRAEYRAAEGGAA